MKKIAKAVATTILTLLTLSPLCGVPARKGTFLVTQPDGTTFMAKLRGDEYSRLLTTEDGCALVKASDGFYQYAYFNPDGTSVCSGYRAGDSNTPALVMIESRNIPFKALRALSQETRASMARKRLPLREMLTSSSAKAQTRTDTKKPKHCIVIPVQFPDLKFESESTRKDDFNNLLNQKGYSRDGATGCVQEYFTDQLGHIYDFSFTVADIVTAPKSYKYYGANAGKAKLDSHPDELTKVACVLADPKVDFSKYDNDGNGIVDNVFIIVAGKSEAEGADSDYIWPHQWSVQENLVLDGKKIKEYAMSTELTVKSRRSDGQLVWDLAQIGTFCHEFSHTLGLVDLYDTDDDGSGGTCNGMWFQTALMDGGSYNNGGKTPPCYNALDYELLSAGKPETMACGTYTLEPVDRNRRYLIMENPKDKYDFYLFECRKATGWDRFIGGNGLAIYHINMTNDPAGYSDEAERVLTALERWDWNEVNCNPDFECADMIETTENPIDVRQAFYPYKGRTSFSANTSPAFLMGDGTPAPFAITGITISGDNVTFTISSLDDALPAVKDLRCEVFQDAAIFRWEADMTDSKDTAVVTWGQTSKPTRTEKVIPYEPGKYSLTLEGLSPTTAYSMNVVFKRGARYSDPMELDILTKALSSHGKPYIFLDYLEESKSGGKFLAGTGFPLRVHNAVGAKVVWFYDGEIVTADGSGYFHPRKSGVLKAKVDQEGKTRDILVKEIQLAQ
jgi:M6 family metalloprotease domain